MEDRELVERILKEGDTRSYSKVVSRYSAAVFSKTLAVVKQEALARDVTQQTFIRAYANLDVWRGTSLMPWLTAIAMHLSLNVLEKERRRQQVSLEKVGQTADTGEGGYSEEREMMMQRMEKAIEGLPDGDKRLIRMFYYEHRQTEDIAKRVGMSATNVRVRLHRIRELLKKRLTEG